jgi:hypothetical protein
MLSIAVLAACGDSGQPLAPSTAPRAPLASAQTETTNEFVPVSFTQFVSCANGGAGEDVLVEGTAHEVFHVTETPSGLFRVHFHGNFQGVSGTGLTTGDTYRVTDVANAHLHLGPGVTDTFSETYALVGPGPDNNLTIRETYHVTINANGELTVARDTFTVECS